MHQGFMALAPHGLDHAERRQRIDKAGGAFGGRDAGGQYQTSPALIVRYCVYMAPPIIATVLPSALSPRWTTRS